MYILFYFICNVCPGVRMIAKLLRQQLQLIRQQTGSFIIWHIDKITYAKIVSKCDVISLDKICPSACLVLRALGTRQKCTVPF